MYKQVILVRQDLQLPKGKLAVQVAHASVENALKCDKKLLNAWQAEGMKKIVLKVKDEKELRMYIQHSRDMKLLTCLITDAGLTTVAPGTTTCGGIGPDEEEKIDRITGKLKMM